MKRRTEIKVEEVIRISRRPGAAPNVSCPDCAAAWMISPDEAALALGATTRSIYRWIEKGRVHFFESGSGTVLVCLRSIGEQVQAQAREMESGNS